MVSSARLPGLRVGAGCGQSTRRAGGAGTSGKNHVLLALAPWIPSFRGLPSVTEKGSWIARAGLEANPFWVAPQCPCRMDCGCDPCQGAGRQGSVPWS